MAEVNERKNTQIVGLDWLATYQLSHQITTHIRKYMKCHLMTHAYILYAVDKDHQVEMSCSLIITVVYCSSGDSTYYIYHRCNYEPLQHHTYRSYIRTLSKVGILLTHHVYSVTVCETHVEEAQWGDEEHQEGVNMEDSHVLPVFSVL